MIICRGKKIRVIYLGIMNCSQEAMAYLEPVVNSMNGLTYIALRIHDISTMFSRQM